MPCLSSINKRVIIRSTGEINAYNMLLYWMISNACDAVSSFLILARYIQAECSLIAVASGIENIHCANSITCQNLLNSSKTKLWLYSSNLMTSWLCTSLWLIKATDVIEQLSTLRNCLSTRPSDERTFNLSEYREQVRSFRRNIWQRYEQLIGKSTITHDPSSPTDAISLSKTANAVHGTGDELCMCKLVNVCLMVKLSCNKLRSTFKINTGPATNAKIEEWKRLIESILIESWIGTTIPTFIGSCGHCNIIIIEKFQTSHITIYRNLRHRLGQIFVVIIGIGVLIFGQSP